MIEYKNAEEYSAAVGAYRNAKELLRELIADVPNSLHDCTDEQLARLTIINNALCAIDDAISVCTYFGRSR